MTDQEFRKSIRARQNHLCLAFIANIMAIKAKHKHHATHEHVSKWCEW